MKKAFPFYRSYYEQFQHLDKNQIADLVMTISKVQFHDLHIDDVVFDDKMTSLAWSGVKHSIKASIDGYFSKKNMDYDTTLGKVVREELGDKKKEKRKEKYKDNENKKEEGTTSALLVVSDTKTDANRVANYLLEKILEHKPNFKKPEEGMWEKDIEKAIRLDGRTVEQLLGCIDWIYTLEGNFWIPNVLSAKKLREKFDVMESQMMNSPKNKSRNKTAQVLAKAGY